MAIDARDGQPLPLWGDAAAVSQAAAPVLHRERLSVGPLPTDEVLLAMNLRETRLLLERPRIECGKQGFYMKRGLRSEKMIVLLLTSNIWVFFWQPARQLFGSWFALS